MQKKWPVSHLGLFTLGEKSPRYPPNSGIGGLHGGLLALSLAHSGNEITLPRLSSPYTGNAPTVESRLR